MSHLMAEPAVAQRARLWSFRTRRFVSSASSRISLIWVSVSATIGRNLAFGAAAAKSRQARPADYAAERKSAGSGASAGDVSAAERGVSTERHSVVVPLGHPVVEHSGDF